MGQDGRAVFSFDYGLQYSIHARKKGHIFDGEEVLKNAYLENISMWKRTVRRKGYTNIDVEVGKSFIHVYVYWKHSRGYRRLKGLARFIINMNRYRKEYYSLYGKGYYHTKKNFETNLVKSHRY